MGDTFTLCLFLAALPFEQFSAMGVTVLKLAGGLAFAAWLLGRLRSLQPIRWDLGLTMMVLFLIWGTASGSWSIDPAWSMARLPTYALLLVTYFLIINVITNEKQLSAAMVALWLGTLVLLTSGVADMAGIRLRGQEYRISGFIRNPNTYVAMLVACVPSGYWFVVRTRIPLRRTVAAVAFVIAAATAIYTQSRGGIISVAILLLSLLAFRQTRWRGVVFAVLFLVLGFRLAPLAFWQRWEQTRAMGGDVRTKYLWPAGLSIFTRNPLLGSGLGTNGQALWGMAGARTSVVHNPPLAIAVELGLPGLSLYLGFMAYALVRLLRALAARMRQGSSKETAFAVVLLASFLGYMASWFKGGGAEAQKMLWVLLGLMSAYARMLEQPPSVAGARSLHPGRDGVRSRQ